MEYKVCYLRQLNPDMKANSCLYHLCKVHGGMVTGSTGVGLTLTCGLLRCVLLMSMTLTHSTAIQVAMPTLTTSTALTHFRCVACLRNNYYTKKKLKNVSMINFKKLLSLIHFCFIFNYIYKYK